MRTLVAVLALAALAGGVLAQTAEVDTTPAEAFAAAIAARVEPAEGDAFTFEGEVFLGARKLGTYRFSASVVEEDGRKLYGVEDLGRMTVQDKSHTTETRTWLDGHLTSLRGEEVHDDNGVASSARWTRTEGGYTLVEKRGEAEESEQAIAAPGGLVSNISGVLLFARALPATPGTYAFRTLNALNSDGEAVEDILLTAMGKKEWRGAAALLFHRRDGTRNITFALDPESRDFLGMKMEMEGGQVVEFRPVSAEAVALPADGFTTPAKDAKQCALIAALAFGTGNGDLLASISDWDSIAADMKSKHPEQEYDADTLRAGVVANLNNYQGKQPRDVVLPVIQAMAGQVKVTEEGDRATVVFPPMFQNLTIHVRRFGDEWRMVALPGT